MLLLCCIFTEWSEYSDAVLLSVLNFSMVFMFKIYITVSKSPCYLLKLTFVSFQYLSPFASGVDSPTFQLFYLIGLLHVVELLHLLVEVNHVDLKEFVSNFEATHSWFGPLIWTSKSSFFICSSHRQSHVWSLVLASAIFTANAAVAAAAACQDPQTSTFWSRMFSDGKMPQNLGQNPSN